jgi:hypothetical protein
MYGEHWAARTADHILRHAAHNGMGEAGPSVRGQNDQVTPKPLGGLEDFIEGDPLGQDRTRPTVRSLDLRFEPQELPLGGRPGLPLEGGPEGARHIGAIRSRPCEVTLYASSGSARPSFMTPQIRHLLAESALDGARPALQLIDRRLLLRWRDSPLTARLVNHPHGLPLHLLVPHDFSAGEVAFGGGCLRHGCLRSLRVRFLGGDETLALGGDGHRGRLTYTHFGLGRLPASFSYFHLPEKERLRDLRCN